MVDDTRIRAALPTIEELRRRGARLVLASHLGRPKGRRCRSCRCAPAADRLAELIGADVTLAPGVVGRGQGPGRHLPPGDVLMLENVRFEPGETDNDDALARGLAALADVYVNDAFGAAHRAHASTEAVAHLVADHAAGRLLPAEVETLTRLLEDPRRPLVAMVGGAKVSDKIAVIERFLETADAPDRRRDVLSLLPAQDHDGRRLAVRGGGRRARPARARPRRARDCRSSCRATW